MEKVSLVAFQDPKSPVSEAYRTIRTNLQFSGVDKELKIVEITSSVPNEGKSTVIASLAIVMAQAGKKVLLLDCDFRNPTQHKLFSVTNKGMTNYMANGSDYHVFLHQVGLDNLYLFPGGPVAPNPSEILMSNKMQFFLDTARAEYDFILIDTPPVMPVTDAAALCTKTDGVMLVVASGVDRPEIVQTAKVRLEQAGAHMLGCILNKVRVSSGKYGYGSRYGYGYGYGYGYYYGDKGSDSQEESNDVSNLD